MDDIKIKVINSDKLIKAINEGSYDVNLSAVTALGAVMVDTNQPQYEELTLEEAVSEIASESMISAQYWLDAMIRLKQMGYAICRKR